MPTATSRVYDFIFKLLEENPDGLRWVDLAKMTLAENPDIHPKTLNGLIWKLIEKYPDKVYKTEDKLFRLKKI